jgi:NAD(P)-dependent dehydrogenase (short-subunit alcohol dehydrogenase family)
MSASTHSHIVVSGTSSGIGRATALRLAAAGHHVYAGVRRPADAPQPPSASPGQLTPLLLDVTDPAQIQAAADTVADHTGAAGLDGLVNNAGIGVFGPLELIPIQQVRRLLEVNVTGQLAVTQAFLPLLRGTGGRIIMIGSIGARFTPPFVGALGASKSALATMTEALRQELAPWDVRVVLIEPATIRTEAVDKLNDDAGSLLDQATPSGRALYQDAFWRLVTTFAAQHEQGSPPEVVAEAVARALTRPAPRAHYLVGKHARRMAILAAALPTPVLDRLRRRQAHQPAPGSRVATPETAHAAVNHRTASANRDAQLGCAREEERVR